MGNHKQPDSGPMALSQEEVKDDSPSGAAQLYTTNSAVRKPPAKSPSNGLGGVNVI